ncbi:S8 family serine peptidase [Clostridium sp. P21]|uniref:S8 family serine peptidase n=1 Tax=Clostridium muellerianum TaxID=2716538 RepID=A0A7Y0EEN7_9CLOT|nr:S8 family serine peptidase [Clostridium muellerianum]NMM62109.1 S8 family serine peptidase [Clostridium muellerianum]
MFSIKSKLDTDLKVAIRNKYYKNCRVIIHCKSMPETIEKKIKTYKGNLIHSIPYINCICATLTSNAIERIIEYPQVDYVAFDSYMLLCGNNILSSNGISHQKKYKLTGKNICIGLVDSGVYPHTDLLTPKNKIQKFTDLLNNYDYPYDDNGHGTFISGLICGSGYSSRGIYKGIAENSCLYSVKAFNSLGRGYISDVLFAIATIILDREKYNIKVICLPFELLSKNYFKLSLFQQLFTIASNHNLTVVVPSGHNGNFEGSISGIATLDNCITVSGIDTTKHNIKPYKHSSSGPFAKLEKPDICAAAVDICSLNTNKSYISERNGIKIYPQSLETPYTCYTGTSCAAAYISGVCALLYESNPELTFKDLVSLIKTSCNLLDIPKWLQGAGMIDLNRLLT